MNIIKIIQETATWIEKVNHDFEVNLYRTASFAPEQSFYDMSPDEVISAIGEMVYKRSEILKESNIELIPLNELPNYGRIMYFDTFQAIPDGAAQAESEFYIDDDDAPPSDTWLALGSQLNFSDFFKNDYELYPHMLIAWVPKDQYFFVQGALEVSALDIFKWPDSTYLNDQFSAIKKLFEKPENIIKPQKVVNTSKRLALQKQISDTLGKHPLQRSSSTKSREPNPSKMLFRIISIGLLIALLYLWDKILPK